MKKKKFYKINLPLFLKPRKKFELTRLGKENDGGYLVNLDDVKVSKTLVSFGINDDWSFEKDFYLKNRNTKILCFDTNTSLIFLIKIFLKKFIFFFYYGINETVKSFLNIIDYLFFLKKKINKENISYNSLIKITQNIKSPIFLKIDIEGSEYRILKDIFKIEKKISGMVIEFHNVDLFYSTIRKFVKKIKLNLIHIHANNYVFKYNSSNVLELSFSKKGKIIGKNPKFPHKLDRPNIKNNKDIKINFK